MLSNLTKALILVFFSSLGCSAQVTFQKTYGATNHDRGTNIQLISDGGYIITGYTNSYGAGGADVYLIKTDSAGDFIWTKTFGGSAYDDGAVVQQASDGGYLISGNTLGFGASAGGMYLIRTDSTGNLLWSKVFGPGGHQNYSCIPTADGGNIISGYTTFFGAGNKDAYLIKSDSMGNLVWSRTYGGSAAEDARCIQRTSNGGFITSGYTHSYGAGQDDVFVMKMDSAGNVLWSRTYGDSLDEYGNYIHQTSDGGFVVTGYTTSFGAAATDWFLIKIDSSGNLQWSKTYGGVAADVANMVQQTQDGGYFIGGYSASVAVGSQLIFIIKTDSLGNMICSKAFGGLVGSNALGAIRASSDSGSIACGITGSFGLGGLDVYLIKTTSTCASECNGYNHSVAVTNVQMQVTSPAPGVSSPATTLIIPATIVGSGGMQTNPCSSLDIYDPGGQGSLISVTPNPAGEQLFISLGNAIKANTTAIIYNFLGKEILTAQIINDKTNINILSFSSGIYFINIREGEKSLGVKKFVKM